MLKEERKAKENRTIELRKEGNGIMSGKKMTKGSFTVEMSVYIPLFLLICLATMRVGIGLYQETDKIILEYGEENYWIAEDFYRLNWLQEMQKNAQR